MILEVALVYVKNGQETEFEKDFFKLLNNSVYGKTLQDIRKYKQIDIDPEFQIYYNEGLQLSNELAT